MATVVTVDGIFESIPLNAQITGSVVPKILGVTVFESLPADPGFVSGIPNIFYQSVFNSDVSYQAPISTSTVKPDWRHPERKIG